MNAETQLASYTAKDPESGCTAAIQKLADGRYAVQCDEEPPIIKTQGELLALPNTTDIRWATFEILRQHIVKGHSAR